jgi:hypothetical protein
MARTFEGRPADARTSNGSLHLPSEYWQRRKRCVRGFLRWQLTCLAQGSTGTRKGDRNVRVDASLVIKERQASWR